MSTQAEHGARTGERVTISFEEPGPRDTARVGRRLRAAKAAANQIEQAEGPLQLPPGIKACPACGMLIEKIGGDDNVMCGCEAKAAGGTYQKALRGGGCGHEFNFQTLASMGTGRLGHPANAKQKLFFLDQEDDDEDLVAGAPLRPPPPPPKHSTAVPQVQVVGRIQGPWRSLLRQVWGVSWPGGGSTSSALELKQTLSFPVMIPPCTAASSQTV